MRISKANICEFQNAFYQDAFLDLSESRKQKALRYHNDVDRLSCILGDYLIRKAVSEETGCDLHRVCIRHTKSGMPSIAYPEACGLYVSLSHSCGIVFAAIDSSPIGIDVEHIRDIDESVLKHTLSQDEWAFVGSSRHRFFEVWTKKEAYFKSIGTGLSGCKSLKSVSVFCLPIGYTTNVIASTETYVASVCTTSCPIPS